MYNLKSDQVHWTQLPPSSLCGTAALRSEDGHDVTVPLASLVSSPLIRSIMADLHPALHFTPFVLSCPVDAEVLEIAGEIFTKGVVKVKDDQMQQEVQQLLKLMEVSAILSCITIDPKPTNVGNAWMTEVKLENVILEIKLESQYHSDEDFDEQNQESSDPEIFLESEAAMDSGSPRQRLYIDKMTFTHEEDEYLGHEDLDCKGTLNGKPEKNPKSGINQHDGTQSEEREHNYCDFSTNESCILKSHSRSHPKEKPYKCPNCDYAAARHYHLLRHLRLHAEEKKFKCTEGNFSTNNSKQIKIHERIHDNEDYKFQCPHCDYSTNRNHHMKQHVMIHTGEKPYSCPHCEYSTNHSNYLKRHIRIHTGEKPYSCPHCEYSTNHSSHIKRHVDRIHN